MSDDPFHDPLFAYRDGELPESEAADVERELANDPVLRARLALDETLHGRVKGLLEGGRAPSGLADRVREIVSNETTTTSAEPRESTAGVVGVNGDGENKGIMPSRIRVSWMAVAAVLVLVAGAILAGVLLPQIDDWPARSTSEILVTETATHIDAEHFSCATDQGHRDRKLLWRSRENAAMAIERHLGQPVEVVDFDSLAFEFVGAGPCRVPGGRPSAHLLYRRLATEEYQAAALSVFVTGELGQYGQLGEIRPDIVPDCRQVIKILTDGNLVYLICCCDPNQLGRIAERAARDYGCLLRR